MERRRLYEAVARRQAIPAGSAVAISMTPPTPPVLRILQESTKPTAAVRTATRISPLDFELSLILSRLALAIVLVAGAMPSLLDITITPRGDGPAVSLDICHPAQALDNAGALVPMAAPSRIEQRVAALGFGAPPPYRIHPITDYLPDINPPPPR